MKTLVKFLVSGFGTGTMSAKALGITILICLSVFIIAWYIIAGIVKLVKKQRAAAAVAAAE